MEALTDYNILDIFKDVEFGEMLFTRLQTIYDPTGPRSKGYKQAVEFYLSNPDIFFNDMLDYIKQDIGLIKSGAYLFNKATIKGLTQRVVLPAVGDYIDVKTGREKEINFIPNINRNFNYDREKIEEYYKKKAESGWDD